MLHLTDSDIRASALDFAAVADALAEAFADLARGHAAIHPRVRSACGDSRLATMGALWPRRGVAGVKSYPTVAGRFGFALVLFELASNRPVALIEGEELTRLRTAAMTAMVAARAARRDARVLALLGCGQQGRAQAQALAGAFAFDEIRVVDPQADAAWCEHLQATTGARVRVVGPEAAVREADLVVTATRSPAPVFDGRWLADDAFVAAIGTSTPAGRELDDETLARASRIVVEWRPQCVAEAGELVQWQRGRDLAKVVDLAQLFAGEVPWRPMSDGAAGPTVFKSVGVGLADVAAACAALAATAPARDAT
ncbi:MAG: ornithine cyclodeaminase family protein [Burkholderiaceae bacterium]